MVKKGFQKGFWRLQKTKSSKAILKQFLNPNIFVHSTQFRLSTKYPRKKMSLTLFYPILHIFPKFQPFKTITNRTKKRTIKTIKPFNDQRDMPSSNKKCPIVMVQKWQALAHLNPVFLFLTPVECMAFSPLESLVIMIFTQIFF